MKAIFADLAAPQLYVDLKANPVAITRIARQGLGVHVIRNGHSQIKEALGKNAANGFVAAVEESSHYYLNFRQGASVFPSENTLFYGLLTAKAWREDPALYAAHATLANGALVLDEERVAFGIRSLQLDPTRGLRINGAEIMMSDGMRTGPLDFQCMSLSMSVPSEAEADRLFNALAANGTVQMPIGKTFFSPRFGAVADKFGVAWMIMVQPEAAP